VLHADRRSPMTATSVTPTSFLDLYATDLLLC
jgi:hypothetical protein